MRAVATLARCCPAHHCVRVRSSKRSSVQSVKMWRYVVCVLSSTGHYQSELPCLPVCLPAWQLSVHRPINSLTNEWVSPRSKWIIWTTDAASPFSSFRCSSTGYRLCAALGQFNCLHHWAVSLAPLSPSLLSLSLSLIARYRIASWSRWPWLTPRRGALSAHFPRPLPLLRRLLTNDGSINNASGSCCSWCWCCCCCCGRTRASWLSSFGQLLAIWQTSLSLP